MKVRKARAKSFLLLTAALLSGCSDEIVSEPPTPQSRLGITITFQDRSVPGANGQLDESAAETGAFMLSKTAIKIDEILLNLLTSNGALFHQARIKRSAQGDFIADLEVPSGDHLKIIALALTNNDTIASGEAANVSLLPGQRTAVNITLFFEGGVERSIAVISGSGQSGYPRTVLPLPLANPLTVEVRDVDNRGVANVEVRFTILSEKFQVFFDDRRLTTSNTARTGAAGKATTNVYVGQTPGRALVGVSGIDRSGDALPGSPDTVAVDILFRMLGDYSSPGFVDMDGDRDFDLVAGELDGNLNLFRNLGSGTAPLFTLENEIYGFIEVGSYSTPFFIDLDRDGDKDLFIGEFEGTLNYYRNDGSADSPIFKLASMSAGGVNIGSRSTPAFADIDNDSDFDLFVGKADGSVSFYQNTRNDTVFTLIASNWAAINVGGFSAPAFVDIDGDRDFDLFVGRVNGGLNFYRNTGSLSNPVMTSESGLTSAIRVNGHSFPSFADIDQDGDFDLFVGEGGFGSNLIHFFRNTGSPQTPAFNAELVQ